MRNVCFFILLVIGLGFKSANPLTQSAPSIYCEQASTFFAPEKSLLRFPIDYTWGREFFYDSLEKRMNMDLCWKDTAFGMVLGDSTILRTSLMRKGCDQVIRDGIAHPAIYVKINLKGQLLVNGDLVKLNDLPSWIPKHYPSTKEWKRNEFAIMWDSQAPTEKIEGTFHAIVKGYLQVQEQEAQKRFNQTLCALSKQQIGALKASLPFVLRIDCFLPQPPPPPPPLIFDKD